MCHCRACQRRTGSVYGVQARFAASAVTVQGPATPYTRTGDSGGKATFRFCPTCGAIVVYELDGMPDVVVIPVGAFADASFPPPTFSVYRARKPAWVHLPDSITTDWD